MSANVVIQSNRGYRPKYITSETSLTTDISEAEVFTPLDYGRLTSFLTFLTDQFGDCFELVEVDEEDW